MEENDLIVSLTVPLVIWVGAIAVASVGLILNHWKKFRRWWQQDRDTIVKMSLWLGIPLFMVGVFWMRSLSIYLVATVKIKLSDFNYAQVMGYLSLVLIGSLLILWWVCDRAWGRERGDKFYLITVIFGLVMGVAMHVFLKLTDF